MRGSNTLFADIFCEEPSGKGRKTCTTLRNECLIDRFYYYSSKTPRPCYNDVINILSDEFFLSPFTIPEIISDNYSILRTVRQNQPSIRNLRDKWKHLVWK